MSVDGVGTAARVLRAAKEKVNVSLILAPPVPFRLC